MDDVAKVKEAIDIVGLISEYVPLKKSGRNFKACCPFHQEKTPSFYVSAERQTWHCFGCSRGGDIFSFVMEMEKVEFIEALRMFAKRAGIQLTQSYQTTKQQEFKDRLHAVNHLISEYYNYLLTKHKAGERARTYLSKRGIKERIVEAFRLGYAPNSWDAQLSFLKKKGFTTAEMEQTGLILRGKSGRFYDRFRGRLMFPIRDHRGDTIAFSGRLLDSTIKEAKYINSPETPLYVKGNTLYGLDVAKDAIRREGSVIVVEGEFDFLSSFQEGVGNVVAIKGSALTEGQIKLLKRFADKLLFALDSDLAGDEAARRGIALADEAGFLMQVVQLPTGKDPHDCIRENVGLWKEAIKQAIPIYDYFIASALKRYDVKTVEGKKRISDEVIPIVRRITNPIIQGHYARELSKTLQISEEQVINALERTTKLPIEKRRDATDKPGDQQQSRRERLEETIVALLLQSDDAPSIQIITSHVSAEDFHVPSLAALFNHLKIAFESKELLPLARSLLSLPSELIPAADRLLLLPLEHILSSEEKQDHVRRVVSDFSAATLRRKIADLTTKIREVESGEETASKDETLKKLNQTLAMVAKEFKTHQQSPFAV